MFTQRVSIEIKNKAHKQDAIDAFQLLMDNYRSSGQIQGRIQSEYYSSEELVSMPYTLEKDSLSSKHNNFYVKRQVEVIELLCGATLKIGLLGQVTDLSPGKPDSPDIFILKTDYYTIGSPLVYGTTNAMVPLYHLPVYYDFGYQPILSWETNYKACDDLFMNSEVGSRWALNQLQNPSSELSLQGREICRNIEKLSSTKTYYYLLNYKLKDSPFCPSCKKDWQLTDAFSSFDYKCDSCRLVTNKTIR